jgi:hypothetical protein
MNIYESEITIEVPPAGLKAHGENVRKQYMQEVKSLIQEIGYVESVRYGIGDHVNEATLLIRFDLTDDSFDDLYDLAIVIASLERELNSFSYGRHISIPKPYLVME